MRLLLYILLLTSLDAKVHYFESTSKQNTLVELFSSEGCSSCPPAEAFINDFKHDSALFTTLFPLTFHVDYWDYLGWKDPFSRPSFSSRQRQYYNVGKSSGVYTPGFFVNTNEWRGWFSKTTLNKSSLNKGILKVTHNKNSLGVRYTQKADTLHVAILGFELKSTIKSGENRSKVLVHDFVVIGYGEQSFNNNLTYKLPKITLKSKKIAIVVWLTRDGVFEQVTGGYLD